MQLNLKTKVVRFELVDDEQETTITLSSDDDQETICRKLRRVLSLTEPEMEEPAPTHEQVWVGKDLTPSGYVDGAKIEPRPGNGWAKYAKPEVPERLKGEVEMIEEGE